MTLPFYYLAVKGLIPMTSTQGTGGPKTFQICGHIVDIVHEGAKKGVQESLTLVDIIYRRSLTATTFAFRRHTEPLRHGHFSLLFCRLP